MDISERIELLLAKSPDDLTQDEVKFLEEEGMKNYMFEQSIKLLINSIYGAFANNFFHFYNVDIAETVTTQGQDAIKYTEKATNHYVTKLFHTDADVLKRLGAENPVEPITNNAAIYIDTDSIRGDSLIRTEISGTYSGSIFDTITIEKLFETEAQLCGFGIDDRGNEVVRGSTIRILNYDSSSYSTKYVGIKALIRHRVRKPKWKIESANNCVITTGDHSIMVQGMFDSEPIAVKPQQIKSWQRLVCYGSKYCTLDVITSCKEIGEFEDEYVYDIEVDDESHTFFANDILVHNSCYIQFADMMKAVDWKGSSVDFVLKLNEIRLKDYFNKVLAQYSKNQNLTENFLDFELETIADNGIWVAKKKYIQNIRYKDGKVYDPVEYIKGTGLEIIQSSTPIFCREKISELMKFLFMNPINMESYEKFIGLIKQAKQEFEIASIDKTAMGRSISDYHKYVANDTTAMEVRSKCPIHVRAAAYHNYLVNSDPKMKSKYQLIGNSEKLKFYYCDDDFCNVFAFKPGNFPIEFAPKMNFEEQFKVSILEPMNRIISPAGYQEMNTSLAYTTGLF